MCHVSILAARFCKREAEWMGASLGELSASSEFGDPRSGHIVYIMSIYIYVYIFIYTYIMFLLLLLPLFWCPCHGSIWYHVYCSWFSSMYMPIHVVFYSFHLVFLGFPNHPCSIWTWPVFRELFSPFFEDLHRFQDALGIVDREHTLTELDILGVAFVETCLELSKTITLDLPYLDKFARLINSTCPKFHIRSWHEAFTKGKSSSNCSLFVVVLFSMG